MNKVTSPADAKAMAGKQNLFFFYFTFMKEAGLNCLEQKK